MGIESTREISREDTIERISSIIKLIEDADWVELYKIAENEDDGFEDEYVNKYNEIYQEYHNNNKLFKSLDKWPNKYLEDFMDKMGVRYSMFENYMII